jgi:hypothetical protein
MRPGEERVLREGDACAAKAVFTSNKWTPRGGMVEREPMILRYQRILS